MVTQNCVVLSLQKQSAPSQAWWLTPVIPAFRRRRQRDCQAFKANLSLVVRLYLKRKERRKSGQLEPALPKKTLSQGHGYG